MASPQGQEAAGADAATLVGPPRRPRRDRDALARRLAVVDLAEGLAHDLKNQLTVVAASVQLARGGDPDPPTRDLLDRAFHAAMRAAELVDEMLAYSRSGGPPGRHAAADVCETVETAVAGAWSHCHAKRVELEMRPGPNEGLPRVASPPAALRVLLWRLLCYTADHACPGVRLLVAAELADARVALRVSAHEPLPALAPGSRPPAGPLLGRASRPDDGVEAERGPLAAVGPLGPAAESVPWTADAWTGAPGVTGSAAGTSPMGPWLAGSRPGAAGTDADELSIIAALAAQAGAALRWEADGAALLLVPSPAAGPA